MQNLGDISNPTTALDMAFEFMSKAFQLNNTTPTNNNQRIQNQGIQNAKNQNGLIVISGIANQNPNRNGNVVIAQAEGNANGNNGNQIRCYNCQGDDHLACNCRVKPGKQDAAYLQKQMQIALKEEAGIQLTQEEFDFMADAGAYEEIERHLKFIRDFKYLAKEADESLAKHKALELEILGVRLEADNVFDSISDTGSNSKIIDSLQDKLHDTIYENAKLRAQLFDKVSEQKDTNKGTSVNTQFSKQSILGKPPSSSKPKLYSVTPFPKSTVIPKVGKSNALSKPVTSNSAPSSRESSVVNNERVIAPGIFRINPFKASRVDNFVPNKHVKASIRTKPITVSQPHVITKKDVNSNINGFSPKDVESTTRPRRTQPRDNPKNDKASAKSKSSCLSSNLEKIKENHRNLQSSSNQKHKSSKCKNIKLVI
ncbi:hypothetical protein Tco_0853532 [Tanacetum coccineum]